MKKLLQMHLAGRGVYKGALDGRLTPEFVESIKDYLSTDTEDWDDKRVFVAGLQKMARDNDLYDRDIDGVSNPPFEYAMLVYAARASGQADPPKQTFEAPKKRAAPPRYTPPVTKPED